MGEFEADAEPLLLAPPSAEAASAMSLVTGASPQAPPCTREHLSSRRRAARSGDRRAARAAVGQRCGELAAARPEVPRDHRGDPRPALPRRAPPRGARDGGAAPLPRPAVHPRAGALGHPRGASRGHAAPPVLRTTLPRRAPRAVVREAAGTHRDPRGRCPPAARRRALPHRPLRLPRGLLPNPRPSPRRRGLAQRGAGTRPAREPPPRGPGPAPARRHRLPAHHRSDPRDPRPVSTPGSRGSCRP
jgi:hypothetical protein